MPPSSKRKRKARNQNRNGEDRYCNPKKVFHTSVILTDQENLEDEFGELYNSDGEDELDVSNRKESKDDSRTPKSTYYDKYEPNSIFTKAPTELDKASSDLESETDSYVYKINKRAKDLKKQLEQNHGTLTVKEYNYKRAIFEYFSLLSNNNGHGKIKASLELLNNKLPSSRHGKHQKTIRIIDDEDIEIKCHI
ncbi:11305_t:CDS:2 [Dentiscutata heterogama]|uniref:11305_t:CDS:1 n=1 Tax=Dentiscutata heterogama TaxID=1316150 RepID=A0ACA9P728_9GLOM|nr:11305_t:CDS:2 [Dentiscutata heterogama]